jgi:hypothetical protein
LGGGSINGARRWRAGASNTPFLSRAAGGTVLYVEDLTTSFARPDELSSVHVELAPREAPRSTRARQPPISAVTFEWSVGPGPARRRRDARSHTAAIPPDHIA